MKVITKTVWFLSIISLLTDVASEMLYPVMPLYLKSIQFSVLFIGILEGIAEATAGISKGYFGKMSDNTGKRLPFVRLGYSLSAISKPLMAAFVFPLWIFGVRTLDRLGKGIRTGARDAMLSNESTPQTKATVFGFHRALDTCGAIAGPLLALLFLYFHPHHYRTLFIIAFLPGILAIVFTFVIKEKITKKIKSGVKTSFFDFISYFKESPDNYKKLVIGLLLFALINSSDIFLILKIKEAGASDSLAIGAYIFYNIFYAILSYPLGIMADKIGIKKVFLTGLIIFSLVYFLIGSSNNIYVFTFALMLYGLYAAATEGISKAWISNLVNEKNTATAIGTYTGFQSICTLFASSFTGLIWINFGASIALIYTAIGTLFVFFYLLINTTNNKIDFVD